MEENYFVFWQKRKLILLHNPKDKDSSLQKYAGCNELLGTSTETELNIIDSMKFLIKIFIKGME